MKKCFYLCTMIILLVFSANIFISSIYAALSIDVTEPSSGTDTGVDNDLQKVGQKIWSIVITVLRYAAIGTFIFAGVKYMIASADQKADIKKSMVPLFIGTLVVFGGTYVVDFAIKLFKDIAGITTP